MCEVSLHFKLFCNAHMTCKGIIIIKGDGMDQILLFSKTILYLVVDMGRGFVFQLSDVTVP